jgi:quercetin dioxygenase-like cupin family protein
MSKKVICNEIGQRIAIFIPSSDWNKGLTFYSEDQDYVQVGTWVYDEGKQLQAHRHNIVPRTNNRTQEVIFVKKGSVESTIYDEDFSVLETIRLGEGDCLVLLAGGHGYKILENDTQVLEIKNGPYAGPEVDRTRLT